MRVRTGHISMQFKDSDKQHSHDLEKIFAHAVDRRWAWVTGTEAGPGSGNTAEEVIRISHEADYRPWVPSEMAKDGGRETDCWVAVRKDLIDGDWSEEFLPAIPSSREMYERRNADPDSNPRWGPKGVVTVGFDSVKLGHVNIGVAHYIQGSRDPHNSTDHDVNRWSLNKDLADKIGDWAKTVGRGLDLAFYAGDQNLADNKNAEPQGDTFLGNPLTTVWDELKMWQGTGHGNIDVIASYNKDRRVKAVDVNALSDKEFFLFTDHYLVEAVFLVEDLPARR